MTTFCGTAEFEGKEEVGDAEIAGILSNGGRDVTASIRSCEDRRAGAAPVGLPISKRARCRNRRGGGLQTRSYPVRVRARAPFFGAIVQQQDGALALSRSGCDSPWLHFLFISGTRKTAIRAVRIGETLGAAPRCPTIS